MRYHWQETVRTKDLTIVMVARNLVTLHYPFIEALISTIPLGCRYLIGNFGNDHTKQILHELTNYMPIEVIDLKWACDDNPGWGAVAIGKATQDIISRSPTEYSLNLQACEVYTDSAIASVFADHPWPDRFPPGQVGPLEFKFNHFYGSLNHGGPGYGGYPHAPRLYRSDSKFDRTDAWTPNDYGGEYPKANGWINRYGYCHRNTLTAKLRNHAKLYFDGDPEPKIAGCLDMAKRQTWFDGHPNCVEHLINLVDYDVNFSLDYAKKNLLG